MRYTQRRTSQLADKANPRTLLTDRSGSFKPTLPYTMKLLLQQCTLVFTRPQFGNVARNEDAYFDIMLNMPISRKAPALRASRHVVAYCCDTYHSPPGCNKTPPALVCLLRNWATGEGPYVPR